MSITIFACPACKKNSMQTDAEAGELLCSSCGFVFEERMQESKPEWRAYYDEADRSRVGTRTSLTMHDMGLATIIGNSNRDGIGRPLSSSMKLMVGRLRLWDSRIQGGSSAERNLRSALNELIKVKAKLGLTESIIENAAYLYRKTMEKGLVRGRSVYGIMGACIYAACRNSQTPRTLDDIATSLNIKRKHVAKYYRVIHNELKLQVPVLNPINSVSRIASVVNSSEKTKRKAIKIITKAKELGMVEGKDPMGIAAAALYLSSISIGENCTQKEISDASGISQVTIRQRCIKLK